MSDLQAVYRAAVEAAPESLDGDFASVERMVDAALAALGPIYRFTKVDYARTATTAGAVVRVFPQEDTP